MVSVVMLSLCDGKEKKNILIMSLRDGEPGWNKQLRSDVKLSERLAFLGIMGSQIRSHLKSIGPFYPTLYIH